MRVWSVLLTCAFGLAGCATEETPEERPVLERPASAISPGGVPQIEVERFTCMPDTLRAGEHLRLQMPVPHGGDLGIVNPEGRYYFVFQGGAVARSLRPVPASLEVLPFAEWPSLAIDTEALALRPSVYGAYERERVFGAAGVYELRLSENLRTDDGTPIERCRVVFTG